MGLAWIRFKLFIPEGGWGFALYSYAVGLMRTVLDAFLKMRLVRTWAAVMYSMICASWGNFFRHC